MQTKCGDELVGVNNEFVTPVNVFPVVVHRRKVVDRLVGVGGNESIVG